MAFRPYKPPELHQQLRSLGSTERDELGRDHQAVVAVRGPKIAPTHALTVGVKTFFQMYKPVVIVPGLARPSANASPPGASMSIHYKFEESIGSGTFSEIYRCPKSKTLQFNC
jgi:hypothetical protein